MSKPLTLYRLKIERATGGLMPSKYTLILSNNRTHEILGSFTDTDEQIAVQVANALLELNSHVDKRALSRGHIKTLVKFKRAIIHHGINSVHREKDLDAAGLSTTKTEDANLTYLHNHGLLVPDVNAESGYWLITRKGNEFLTGQLAIEKFVLIKDGNVVGHEGPFVTVTDVWSEAPMWPSKDTLITERVRLEPVQAELAI